jgi:anti-sigma factor RsiW
MNCHQARRHFGSYWDDELTQAEREWLEAHFAACPRCRLDYEDHARALEALGALPRIEAPANFTERVVARARRAATAPDRVPSATPAWMPATAAAAVLLVVAMLATPWLAPRQPGPGAPVATLATPEPEAPASSDREDRSGAETALAAVPDSLFDQAANVEFILDPVPLRRGRPQAPSPALPVQAERAVISF